MTAHQVRIENLLVVKPADTAHAFNGRTYLGFEQLTHVPIQHRMLDTSLLTAAEEAWLDAYHARVRERVSPRLEEGSEGWLWLQRATRTVADALRADPVAA